MENTTTPTNPGGKARREHKEATIEIVRRLKLRGLRRASEIKLALSQLPEPINVSERTVYGYISIIKRRNVDRLKRSEGLGKTIEELAIELKDNYAEVSRELWNSFNVAKANKNASAMVQALKEIRETNDKWIEKMQSLGLTFKAPEKHLVATLNAEGIPDEALSNKQALNQDFMGWLKAKYQDPVGSTGSHHQLNHG